MRVEVTDEEYLFDSRHYSSSCYASYYFVRILQQSIKVCIL